MKVKQPIKIKCTKCGKKILVKSNQYALLNCCNFAVCTHTFIHLCLECYNKFLDYVQEETDEKN